MDKIKRFINPILILFLVSLVLFLTNYKQGTFLVGWDNLFPEFNFAANLKMNLASVWQSYRGLGVEDGMANAANLAHTITLFMLSFMFPLNMLRYVFQFLMHFLGGVGIFLLLNHSLKKNKWLALTGALFYELNIGTVQMFYAPFEQFSVHFAAIPWTIYAVFLNFERMTKKRLLLLFAISFLSTPQSLVPTLFITYILTLVLIFLMHILRGGKQTLIKVIVMFVLILSTNLFWLLPFIHGVKQQSQTIRNTKINQMSYDSIYQKNAKRGTVADLLLMRGFMLDINENNLNDQLVPIMSAWNNFINTVPGYVIEGTFAGIFLSGLLKVISDSLRKRFSYERYFLLPMLLAVIMLGTQIPIIGYVGSTARDIFPLFAEAFRFPFTKFFILYIFCFALFFTIGVEWIAVKFSKKLYLLLIIFIFVSVLPAFQGHFFYDVEKLVIPSEYFNVIEYFKNQPVRTRIMTLPQTTFWNWMYYDFGARGSGFLWYGIAQAMLERPFDPWSSYNEQYFNEVYYAVQTGNKSQFKDVIDKYQVNYVLIDGHIKHDDKAQFDNKLKNFVETIYPTAEKFVFGKLTIYKLTRQPNLVQLKSLSSNATLFSNTFEDMVYRNFGDYYFDAQSSNPQYLFPSLFTNKTQKDLEFDFDIEQSMFVIQSHQKLPQKKDPKEIVVPSYSVSEWYAPVSLESDQSGIFIAPIPMTLTIGNKGYRFEPIKKQYIAEPLDYESFVLNGKMYSFKQKFVSVFTNLDNEITFTDSSSHQITKHFSIQSDQTSIHIPITLSESEHVSFSMPEIKLTESDLLNNNGQVESPCSEEIRPGRSLFSLNASSLDLTAQYSSTCFHQYLYQVPQLEPFYIYINSKNVYGSGMDVIVDNPQQRTTVVATKLNTTTDKQILIIPPTSESFYTDYGLHFRNVADGSITSENTISSIDVGFFPYRWLSSMSIQNIQPANEKKNVLIFSESFNNGWIALSLNQRKILTHHVLVNNWANGWIVDSKTTDPKSIIIVFWPQYLEYFGFILFGISIAGILLYKKAD